MEKDKERESSIGQVVQMQEIRITEIGTMICEQVKVCSPGLVVTSITQNLVKEELVYQIFPKNHIL